MKSRKSVFKIENILEGSFLSMTHYSRKDKRMYKGRRVPFDIFQYSAFSFTNEESYFLRAQMFAPYGRQDVELYIKDETYELLDRSMPYRVYLSMARAPQLEKDTWK